MGKFSESLKGMGKVHNHAAALEAKIELRQKVLDAVGKTAKVFDAFAGPGAMFKAVWQYAGGYVGCDTEWFPDERTCYVADNKRVLRAIDLAPFQIFDLDAFGSPWEQAIIVAARRHVRQGEVIGLLLTEGSSLYLKQGGVPNALVELTGLRKRMSGLGRWQDDIINRALATLCKRMKVTITHRWEAHRSGGAGMRYIGLVLKGQE